MKQPPTTEETASLHSEFNRLTRQAVRYDMSRHYCWEAWLASGYTVEDLRLVIAYIWRRIKAGKRERESFKLSVLIGDLSKFEDDLSIARSESTIAQKDARRPAVAPGKASVLRATGRETDSPKASPEAVAAIVAACLEKMRRDTA